VALTLFVTQVSSFPDALRSFVFDGYQRLIPMEREVDPVAVVVVDEESLAAYGQWPWPRTRIAELVDKLAEYQPASIGFDILFSEPDRFSPAAVAAQMPILPADLARALQALPSNDEQLARAMKGRNVVLGIGGDNAAHSPPPRATPIVTKGERVARLAQFSGYIGNVEVLDAAAAGRGLLNSWQADQVVRVVPLVQRVQGAIIPSLGTECLRVAVGAGLRIEDAPGGLLQMRFADMASRLQEDGNTWLRMTTPQRPLLSAKAVLEGKVDRDALAGKVVLVGMSGLGVQDWKFTPLGDLVPGVTLHAQVIEDLYNGVSLVRPAFMLYVEAAMLVAAGLLLIAFVPRLSALQGINLAVAFVFLEILAGFVAFRQFNVLLDFAWPVIGTLAVFGSVVVGTLSEAERQRRVLREEAAHMAGEVDAARRIQMGLLPVPQEALGIDRRYGLAALLEPARTVGGDFYDCFLIDPTHLFFVVADVSGKGLPAALFMASVKSQIKSAALRGGELGAVFRRAQSEIQHENPEQLFVTAFAGILDIQSGELEYSNAGHEPPIARTAGGAPARFENPDGPPLCVIDRFEFPTRRRPLAAGEWLCVVTDGVTEAMNPAREFFGGERLRTSLAWMPEDVQPGELIARLREDLNRFTAGAEPADDITLLVVRWNGAGSATSGR